MNDKTPEVEVMMSVEESKEANEFIVEHLQGMMSERKLEFGGLRKKLSITYWVIIVFSIIMFAMGIVLLSVPIVAAFRNDISGLQSLTAAGFGIADLAGLFLFRPIERIHSLMGDMSQITVALNSFQTQAGLLLLEMNAMDRPTIDQAAERISAAAKESIKLVQDYFEAKGPAQ